jgi:hypothetical protein
MCALGKENSAGIIENEILNFCNCHDQLRRQNTEI